jgi:hypothetical protein
MLLIFICSFAAAQRKTEGRASKTTAEQLLENASRLTDLSSIGPLKLTAKVHMLGMAAGPADAQFELYWVGPQRWRKEWHFQQWVTTTVRINNKMWRQTNVPQPAFRLLQFESALRSIWHWTASGSTPNGTAAQGDRVRMRKIEGVKTDCVEGKGRTGPVCFDINSALPLRVESDIDALGTYSFSDYRSIGNVFYPAIVKVDGFLERPTIEAQLDLQNWTPDDSAFVPAKDAVVLDLPICPGSPGENGSPAFLMNSPRVPYPEGAKGTQHKARVVYEMTIAADGHVRKLILLQSGGPVFDDATVELLKTLHYTPSTLCGTPVEIETIVAVNYQSTSGSNVETNIYQIESPPGSIW